MFVFGVKITESSFIYNVDSSLLRYQHWHDAACSIITVLLLIFGL